MRWCLLTAAAPIYVADHYSLSDAGLRSRLPSTVLRSFDMENDRLHLTLILDFAVAICHKVNTTVALDALVQNYVDRNLQYIGSNLNRSLGVQYLLRLIDMCKGMISKVGRYPYDARDFIHNFLFNAARNMNLRALHYQEQPQSIRVNSSWVLEVKCFGDRDYKRISVATLREFLSEEGIISSVLPLLWGSWWSYNSHSCRSTWGSCRWSGERITSRTTTATGLFQRIPPLNANAQQSV